MNIQVNKDQLDRIVIKWLNTNFGNLTPKTTEKYPNSVYYVNSNNKIMMEYKDKIKEVWIDYYNLWLMAESLFHLEYDDIESIMKVWLEETYKLKWVTPYIKNFIDGLVLDETYKLENKL